MIVCGRCGPPKLLLLLLPLVISLTGGWCCAVTAAAPVVLPAGEVVDRWGRGRYAAHAVGGELPPDQGCTKKGGVDMATAAWYCCEADTDGGGGGGGAGGGG